MPNKLNSDHNQFSIVITFEMSTSINEQQQLDAQISEEAQWNSFNENQSIANENLFDYKKLLLNGLVIVTIFLITINSLLTVWIMFKIGFSWVCLMVINAFDEMN